MGQFVLSYKISMTNFYILQVVYEHTTNVIQIWALLLMMIVLHCPLLGTCSMDLNVNDVPYENRRR